MGIDPVGVNESNIHSFNRYAYANNNPIKFVDPDGRYADLAIEALSIGLGLASFDSNWQQGNYGSATVDALGVGVDMFLAAIPGAPGAAGLGIKAVRGVADDAKTYITYTKKNLDTGEIYSGRASGYGTPEQVLAKRDATHHMNDKGFEPAELDKFGSKNAIRGREQDLIDAHGGAKSTGGTSGNTINGISAKNKNAPIYRDAAKKEFGN